MGGYRHTVKEGECVSSIAFENGLVPDRVWNDPENRALRQSRDDQHVLRPGDVLFVPDRVAREVTAKTNATHRFRRKAVPERLRLRFVDARDQPRAGVSYELRVGDQTVSGATDSDGLVLEWIPPNAQSGKLTLRGKDGDEDYELELGHLDPIADPSGVRARLTNLGYDCGDEDGDELGPLAARRLGEFQTDHDLDPTGELDDRTRDALLRAHGS